MSSRLSAAQWDQMKTAHASGIGLREVARNMDVSENTVLARARREKWTQQIAIARQHAKPVHSNAITPMHSAAITMQQRGERYVNGMAIVSEKVVPHIQKMKPGAILGSARNIEQFDRFSRRNYGLDNQAMAGGPLSGAVLITHSAVKIDSQPSSDG